MNNYSYLKDIVKYTMLAASLQLQKLDRNISPLNLFSFSLVGDGSN